MAAWRVRTPGGRDLQRAAAELAARLPDPLGPLARIAYNYAWSWQAGGHELFAVGRSTSASSSACATRCALLQEASGGALERAAGDGELLERAAALEARIEALMQCARRRQRDRSGAPGRVPVRRVRRPRVARRSTPAASARWPGIC